MLIEEKIQQIPLDDLIPSPGNRRIGGFDPDKLQQLADSIQAVGVQQPIIIRSNGRSKFEIVAGERRWKAARIAGRLDIPAVVRDLDDVTVIKIQTIENLQREDIHPLDEADGYSRLIEQAGYDVEHLAQEVGRSPSYVYQRLKLRDLTAAGKKLLAENEIHAGHAVLIARLPAKQQDEVVKKSYLFKRGDPPSVREVDDFIHRTVLLDLNKATFKKDDPELDLKAGPCTTCPKRTGYQPALFADVCNGGKRDYCTDPPCFKGKLDALVERKREELKEAEGVLEVIAGYIDYSEEKKLKGKKLLSQYEWEECKKKADGAMQCLIVAGADRGRVTWGRKLRTNRYGIPEKTAEEKAEDKAVRKKIKEGEARRQMVFDQIIETAAVQLGAGDNFLDNVEVLRSLVRHVDGRLWDQHRKKMRKMSGWDLSGDWQKRDHEVAAAIDAMSQTELRLFLLKALIIGSLDYNEYSPAENAAPLIALADLFDVVVSDMKAEVKAYEKKRAEQKQSLEIDEAFLDDDPGVVDDHDEEEDSEE